MRPARRRDWGPVVDRMLAELRGGAPRADTYWAQQIAFGPVFVHALAMRARHGLDAADSARVGRVVALALAALGPLPDGPAGDPSALPRLARRQAAALASGRRQFLRRLAERLQTPIPDPSAPVPGRLLRPYRLMGWQPPQAAAG